MAREWCVQEFIRNCSFTICQKLSYPKLALYPHRGYRLCIRSLLHQVFYANDVQHEVCHAHTRSQPTPKPAPHARTGMAWRRPKLLSRSRRGLSPRVGTRGGWIGSYLARCAWRALGGSSSLDMQDEIKPEARVGSHRRFLARRYPPCARATRSNESSVLRTVKYVTVEQKSYPLAPHR